MGSLKFLKIKTINNLFTQVKWENPNLMVMDNYMIKN